MTNTKITKPSVILSLVLFWVLSTKYCRELQQLQISVSRKKNNPLKIEQVTKERLVVLTQDNSEKKNENENKYSRQICTEKNSNGQKYGLSFSSIVLPFIIKGKHDVLLRRFCFIYPLLRNSLILVLNQSILVWWLQRITHMRETSFHNNFSDPLLIPH